MTKTKKTPKPQSKTKTAAKTKKATDQKPVTFLNLPPTITINTKHLQYLILVLVIAIAGAIYLFKDQFIVATVNGKPITKRAYTQEVNKQVGSRILENLVSQALIQQEAYKQNISVTDQEIQEDIAKLEENVAQNGQDFDQLLTLQGTTRSGLTDQIRFQKLLQKLAPAPELSQEDIDLFLEENGEFLPEDATEDELQQLATEQLTNEQQTESIQTLITDLQTSATINYFLKLN